MTAKTKDGKEVFSDTKIYMLQCTDSRGGEAPSDVMIYGAQRKMGYIVENTFMPLQTKIENYEIKFPYEDVVENGKKVRKLKAKEMDIDIELRWQNDPDYVQQGEDWYLLYKTTKNVKLR
ncbi:MAG: hypothetical protein ACK415_09195 [Thermodesulfovibrionales bacterium]